MIETDQPEHGGPEKSPEQKAREKALRRARQLLAQAESFAGMKEHDKRLDAVPPEERARECTEQAMRILADHGLSEAMLADRKHDSRDVIVHEIELEAPQAAEKAALLGAIGRCYDARTVSVWKDSRLGRFDKKTGNYKVNFRYGKGGTARVYGFRGDIEQIEMLYTSLLLQAVSGMLNATVPEGTRPAEFRSAFLYGFRDGVYERLWRIRLAAKRKVDNELSGNGRGMELVLADRKVLVDRRYEAENKNLQSMTEFRGRVGREDGYQAGLTADLHQTPTVADDTKTKKVGASRKALPTGSAAGGNER